MKKIQKQYERKIRVNQNNDVFTTFQKYSHADYSPLLPKKQKESSSHQTQRQHIQSLKSTLKSLVPSSMEITKQFTRVETNEQKQEKAQQSQNDEYRLKLDQLTKNLQQIASKCHFSPANLHSAKYDQFSRGNKNNLNMFQADSRYQPMLTEQLYRYTNNASIQLPINRNNSLIEKETYKHHSQSKSNKKHQSSGKEIKFIYEEPKKNQQSSSNKKKSYSKKQVFNNLLLQPSNSKNLVKTFQQYQNNHTQLLKGKEHSTLKKVHTIYNKKIHRHRITNILITDQIYTSSLDYTIKNTYQYEGEYQSQTLQKFRGGVEHIGSINDTIFGCGRDHYLRSIDGNYFHRFDTIPLSFSQSDKSNLINITFKTNQLKLFDLQKKDLISSLNFDNTFTTMSKFNKDIYVGTNGALFAVDWRNKDYLINLYRDNTKQNCNWISDPHSKTFWLQNDAQLTILNHQFRKIKAKSLQLQSQFVTYSWNRHGLHMMVEVSEGYRLLKYDQSKDVQEIDGETQTARLCKVVVREKQIVYGGREGDLIIKQLKK